MTEKMVIRFKPNKIMQLRITRGIKKLWFGDIWHLQPSAPLSWRYFLPAQPPVIQMHRQLWWRSRYKLPRLFWVPLELGRWVHWQLVAAPRQVREAVNFCGPETEICFSISQADQISKIKYWVRNWCIDPYDCYSWQLFLPDADGLEIIYKNQTAAYHMLQNRRTGAVNTNHRLLGDKILLAETLAEYGIPMVATTQVSQGDWHDIEAALMRRHKLFCKLRSGKQGESAFAVWSCKNAIQGLAHDGTILPDENAVRKAWRILSGKGEVLIQPFLVNHSALVPVAVDSVAVTLRVVTRVELDGIRVWWAELQAPTEVSSPESRGFWRFPVSVSDGAILPMSSKWFLKQSWRDEYAAIWQILSQLERLPHWNQIYAYSVNAHETLPKVWSIAWDWVITPDGPVLLEGNGGWGLDQIQQQGVDLVSFVTSQ